MSWVHVKAYLLFVWLSRIAAFLCLVSCVLKVMISYIFFLTFGCFKQEIKPRPCYSILAESRSLDAGLLSQVCDYVALVSFWLLFWGCSLALLLLHLPTALITIWFPEVKWVHSTIILEFSSTLLTPILQVWYWFFWCWHLYGQR